MALARSGIVVVLCFSFVGCGGGSHAEPPADGTIAQGGRTANCKSAVVGAGDARWRQRSTWVGRFGVYGSGRDFRTAQKQSLAGFSGLQERHVHGPILVTKTPLVVEGKTPVTVAIAPRDRSRAGLVAGVPFGDGPYAEIRLVPCRDQPRTGWAAGWVLRDQGQVTVSVRPVNEPESQLVVGRP